MPLKVDLITPCQAIKKIEAFLQAWGLLLCFFCFWTIIINRIINSKLTPWGQRCLPDQTPCLCPRQCVVMQILDASASSLDPSVSPCPPHFFLFCVLLSLHVLFYWPISVEENMECGNMIQHGVRKVFLFPNIHSGKKKVNYAPSKFVKH